MWFFIAPNDYSSIDIPLVFVPDDLSNRSLCENISISTDLVVENTEVFTLSISTTDSAVSLQLESSPVNITDDSGEEVIFVKPVEFLFHVFYHKIFIVVTAFLDEDEYTVSEADGALEVCVVLDGFIDREVTVNLSTVDETAIGISSLYIAIFFQ